MPTIIYLSMLTGTMLRNMALARPWAALFFNHSPTKIIVACRNDIFIVDLSTQSSQSFISTPQGAHYRPHAIALSEDDSVLVAGNWSSPCSTCGYDTASLTKLWSHQAGSSVQTVCMLGTHVLVAESLNFRLVVLDCKTGAQIADLQNAVGGLYGLGAFEGMFC